MNVKMTVRAVGAKCPCGRPGRNVDFEKGESTSRITICEGCARNLFTLMAKSPGESSMEFPVASS